MKKTLALTLALVFVLGIAGTAFAANPFVDVPANHWAYPAVKQLVKAGLVDGMNDGTFKGDKEMTRYEMAQIVAKAMTKVDKADAADKAAIEKLQAEFAAELDNLGVRVSNLEKKVGNIKVTGDTRIRYINTDKSTTNPNFGERLRVTLNADVNENTSFMGRYMVMNTNEMGTTGKKDTNQIINAAMTTKNIFHNTDVMVGRYDMVLGQTNYLAGSNGMADGIQANVNMGKANLALGYASLKPIFTTYGATTDFAGVDNTYYSELNYKFDNNTKMNVNYMRSQDNVGVANDKINIVGVGVTTTVLPNVKLIGDYWKNTADAVKSAANGNNAPKAYVVDLAWKGNKATVPGSWGLVAEYLKIEAGAADANLTGASVPVGRAFKTPATATAAEIPASGLKAFDVQFHYTLANNITFSSWYMFNMKDAQTGNDYLSDVNTKSTSYTRAQVNFMF